MTRQSAMNCSPTRHRMNVWLTFGRVPQPKQKHRHDRGERDRNDDGDKPAWVNSERRLRDRRRQLVGVEIEADDDECDDAVRQPERKNVAQVVSGDAGLASSPETKTGVSWFFAIASALAWQIATSAKGNREGGASRQTATADVKVGHHADKLIVLPRWESRRYHVCALVSRDRRRGCPGRPTPRPNARRFGLSVRTSLAALQIGSIIAGVLFARFSDLTNNADRGDLFLPRGCDA